MGNQLSRNMESIPVPLLAKAVEDIAAGSKVPPEPVYKTLCKDETKRQDDITNLNSNIQSCSKPDDITRNETFGEDTVKLNSDIEMLRALIGDSFYIGDAIYGSYGISDITKQVKARNTDLKRKKEILKEDIYKKEAIVERSDRDFSDVKNTLPETQPKKALHFLEDYTMAFLVMAYLFMMIALNYLYATETKNTENQTFNFTALLQGLFGSVIITIFLSIILYYFT